MKIAVKKKSAMLPTRRRRQDAAARRRERRQRRAISTASASWHEASVTRCTVSMSSAVPASGQNASRLAGRLGSSAGRKDIHSSSIGPNATSTGTAIQMSRRDPRRPVGK